MNRILLVFTIFLASSPIMAEAGWYTDCPLCREHIGGSGGTAGPFSSEAECNAERINNNPHNLPWEPCYSDGSSSGEDREASRFVDLKLRFAALFNNLRQYDNAWERIDHLFGGIPPANIRKLDQWVDQLYLAAILQKRYQRREWKNNEKYIDELRDKIRQAKLATPELEAELATAPDRLKRAEAQRDHWMAMAGKEEPLAFSLWNSSERAHSRLWESRGRSWAIYYLLPEERKGAFSDANAMGAFVPAYWKRKLLTPNNKTTEFSIFGPPGAVATDPSEWRSPTPTAPAGSIETKLDKIKALGVEIADLSSHVIATGNTAGLLNNTLQIHQEDNERLVDKLRRYKSPIQKASELADDFKERFLTAKVNKDRSAASALRLAACSIVWDHATNTIVVPQIEKFLKNNDLLGITRGIQLMDRIRNNPEEFLPKTGPWKDIGQLIEVSRKVIDIEANFESFALEVADSNVHGDIADSKGLVRTLFYELDKRGIEVMHTAAGTMKGPLGEISRRLMENAPKD